MSVFRAANPRWTSVIAEALQVGVRTGYHTAGRVLKDIGGKDPAVARAALRMVGMHAAGGAAVGAIYSTATGGDIGRGALYGGMGGAVFGLGGGLGLVNHSYRYGRFHAARKAYMRPQTRTFNRLNVIASNSANPAVRQRALAHANRISGSAWAAGSRQLEKPDLIGRFGLFNTMHEKAMGGYNPITWR